jgi:sigma-B regulation protein RsbU (phosphoserine phosphatase)
VKILVAEDDAMTRLALSKNLEKWGHEAIAVDNGKQAMAELDGPDPPRLAILDWIMPEMEGVEICRALRQKENSPLIYTILLTIKQEKDDIVQALDCGAHDFLSKPVHVGELRGRIDVGVRLISAEDRILRYAGEIETKNSELEKALAEIKTLRGFIPICSNCKKIRDDEGYWQQIEQYIQARSQAEFSHSICPECMKALYPEFAEKIINRMEKE